MKTQVLTDVGLTQYTELFKDYISKQSGSNTTYTLTKNENNEIVLTGSDGSVMKISDDDTKSSNEIFSTTQPTSQNIGDVWTEFL